MIYEVSRDDDTSSSCSECKRQHGEGSSPHPHHHRNAEQSSEEDTVQPSQPLSPQRGKQQTQIVRMLQEENRRLKLINEDQDRELRELRQQAEMSKLKSSFFPDMARSSKELQRGKLEGQITPKGARIMSPEVKTRTETAESMLQVALLQKQIKQLQLRLLQMSNKLREYEDGCAWMQKFILSFTSMAEELSLNYGTKIQTRGMDLRKRTKVCWRYMKDLINYLIK